MISTSSSIQANRNFETTDDRGHVTTVAAIHSNIRAGRHFSLSLDILDGDVFDEMQDTSELISNVMDFVEEEITHANSLGLPVAVTGDTAASE